MRFLKVIALLLFAAALLLPVAFTSRIQDQPPIEAPTGFDNQTNGLGLQAEFDADREIFDEHELISDGLGPGATTATLLLNIRTARSFIRAIDPNAQEQVMDGNEVRAFRLSLNVLGDGFVEAIADDTLIAIANGQPGQSRGGGSRARSLWCQCSKQAARSASAGSGGRTSTPASCRFPPQPTSTRWV
jgi:hypothetical protein